MPLGTLTASTPHFVLIHGNVCIGPKVMPLDAGMECTAIYGFSDKSAYANFCMNWELALRPYPLVKGRLRSQIDTLGDNLKLVVLNAAGPSEPFLYVATMEAVLVAHESRDARVTAAYRLTFDQQTKAYRVEDVSV